MKKPLLYLLLICAHCTLFAQDSISCINNKTKASEVIKMRQGTWIESEDSGLYWKLTFKGDSVISVLTLKNQDKPYTGRCRYIIQYVDSAKYWGEGNDKYHNDIVEKLNCDLDMDYSDGYYLFACNCIADGVFAISKKHLWLKPSGPDANNKKLRVLEKM